MTMQRREILLCFFLWKSVNKKETKKTEKCEKILFQHLDFYFVL